MSVSDAIPPAEALRAQLAAITGREPASSFVEVRPITPDGRPARERAFVPVGKRAEIERLTVELTPRMNVFLGVCPRVRDEGTAAAVERAWSLWADLDSPAALARLAAFVPGPALVILTGSGGGHAYWPLREPLERSHVQRANRRLALALDGDMGACDAARILRAAGSLNHKHHEPRAVTCTRLTGEIFTRAAEVVGGLADSHHYPKPARPTDARRVSGDPSRILAGLARSVADARVKNRNRMLHWAACRVREHADAGKLDEGHAREELRAAAVHAGLDEFEIEQTIRSGLRKLEAA